jgi:hypothetical protein
MKLAMGARRAVGEWQCCVGMSNRAGHMEEVML